MKALIQHLLRSNRDEVLKRSLMHCHAAFVHSIMLLECPGKTIRLFIAEPGNRLWCNCPSLYRSRQSVGFHAHHCDLTLIPIHGCVFNWSVAIEHGGDMAVKEFQYRSKITHGEIGFAFLQNNTLSSINFDLLPESGLFMQAMQMHTIATIHGEWTAWLALEGKENPDHDNHIFSTQDISKESFDHLYKPMTEGHLERLLKAIEIQ